MKIIILVATLLCILKCYTSLKLFKITKKSINNLIISNLVYSSIGISSILISDGFVKNAYAVEDMAMESISVATITNNDSNEELRVKRKLQLQSQLNNDDLNQDENDSYVNSLKKEQIKQNAMKKTKAQRAKDLCENLGRGC